MEMERNESTQYKVDDLGVIVKEKSRKNYPKHVKNSLMVREFITTFGQHISDTPAIQPRKIAWLRLKLILEEVMELMAAMWKRDLVGIADALADILYVVHGMAIAYGIDLDACFREVHSSNMSKLGNDGKPVYRKDGKVSKGPAYRKPDLRKVMGING